MTHLRAVPDQRAHPIADHPSADALLHYQMTARNNERMLPSGSMTVTLTPAQLDDLAVKYQDDDTPLGRGMRLLWDLDERLDQMKPQVSDVV
ncbi:hypothetical protein AB0M10_15100 [Streptomyces sp. NPDC051840]|uniref:hypothetical protein n=1 Tax=Streptomyces sp. NPDC051840 TaxID=3154752 RepID=UPI00342D63F5